MARVDFDYLSQEIYLHEEREEQLLCLQKGNLS